MFVIFRRGGFSPCLVKMVFYGWIAVDVRRGMSRENGVWKVDLLCLRIGESWHGCSCNGSD